MEKFVDLFHYLKRRGIYEDGKWYFTDESDRIRLMLFYSKKPSLKILEEVRSEFEEARAAWNNGCQFTGVTKEKKRIFF